MTFLPGWNQLETVTAIDHGIAVAILVIIALVIGAALAAFGCDFRKGALGRGAERIAHPPLSDWDTPAALSRLHTVFATAALVAVGLFIVAEIVGQQYGQRHAELARRDDERAKSQQQQTLAAERTRGDRIQQDADRLGRVSEQLKQQLAQSQQDVAQARSQTAQAEAKRTSDIAGLQQVTANADAERQAERADLRQKMTKAEADRAADAAGWQAKLVKAEADRTTEMSGLQQKLVKADQKIEELQALLNHRRLSEDEKQKLLSAIKTFPGQKVSIASIAGDDDGRNYAEDFVAVFDAAGWDHHGAEGVFTQTWDRDPVGVEITLNEADARAGRIAPGVGTLINVVRQLGLVADNTVFMNGDIPPGEIQLRVGKKLRR